MEVVNENPDAIKESLEFAHKKGSEFILGQGQNGLVISSARQDDVCYKTLFLERARKIAANVAREALMQHAIYSLLESKGKDFSIPRVDGFVKTAEVMAIKMKKIEGFSLKEFFDNPQAHTLPEGFDSEVFFSELEEIIELLNDAGYFHRDIYGNAGNIMCDKNGKPVLIDFGSAVKAIDYNPDELTYQIVPNGQRYHKNDLSGVRDLKHRFEKFAYV